MGAKVQGQGEQGEQGARSKEQREQGVPAAGANVQGQGEQGLPAASAKVQGQGEQGEQGARSKESKKSLRWMPRCRGKEEQGAGELTARPANLYDECFRPNNVGNLKRLKGILGQGLGVLGEGRGLSFVLLSLTYYGTNNKEQ